MDFGCKSGYTNGVFRRQSTKARSFKPSVPYSCYNDKELRKLLSSEKLSCNGDRQSLIKRHTEFLNIHNSNLDRLDPNPQEFVVNQVNEWERNLFLKTVPTNNHLERYKEEYVGLIQDVKSRKRKTRQDYQLDEIL